MSTMNGAFKGAIGLAGELVHVTGKGFAAVFNFGKDAASATKDVVDDANYIAGLKKFEKNAGKMPEVHVQARKYLVQRENDCDLPISFGAAVEHVLRERDRRRQDELKSNVRRLEYHK